MPPYSGQGQTKRNNREEGIKDKDSDTDTETDIETDTVTDADRNRIKDTHTGECTPRKTQAHRDRQIGRKRL